MNPTTGAGAGIELDGSDTHDDSAGVADRPISYRALAAGVARGCGNATLGNQWPEDARVGAATPQSSRQIGQYGV